MKIRFSVLAALACAAGFALPHSAFAAANGQASMCSADVAGGVQGPRTIGGTIGSTATNIPSGTLYTLNGQGCTIVKTQDIGWFLSQGFTYAGDGGVIIWQAPVAATGTTSYQVGTLPAGAYIKAFIAQNSDATHAVTGGITCGVAAAGTTIIGTAFLIPVSSVETETDALLLLRAFSSTATQAIFCQAVTSWNTPTTVTLTIPYGYF